MSLRRWADRDVSRDRSSFAFRIFNVSKEGAMGEQVLITGASAGLGVEFARLYAGQGCDLILTARREDRMHALADELRAKHDIQVRVFAADLADPSAPQAIYDWVASEDVAVNILVNNAGFGLRGRFADLPLDRQLAMLRVNVNALTELTGLFLPGMRARGRGGILNVGSTAGFQPGPLLAIYYATKAFVLSFSEALHDELRGTGVRVTCLAPGATRTEFAEAADMTETRLFRMRSMSAGAVARAGVQALERGKALVVPGWFNKLAAWSTRFLPRAWVRRAVMSLQR
jgi:short-subunit dehydrogenase